MRVRCRTFAKPGLLKALLEKWEQQPVDDSPIPDNPELPAGMKWRWVRTEDLNVFWLWPQARNISTINGVASYWIGYKTNSIGCPLLEMKL